MALFAALLLLTSPWAASESLESTEAVPALVWTTVIPGITQGRLHISASSKGDPASVYVLGYAIPCALPKQIGLGDWGLSAEPFLARLDLSGNLLWTRTLSFLNVYATENLAVGPGGLVYVVGRTSSPHFPKSNDGDLGQDRIQVEEWNTRVGGRSRSCGQNAWIACFDITGALRWKKRFGGNEDFATYAAVDSSGNAYVSGRRGGKNEPTSNPYFIAKLTPQGKLAWWKAFGQSAISGRSARNTSVAPDGHVTLLEVATKSVHWLSSDQTWHPGEHTLTRLSTDGDVLWTTPVRLGDMERAFRVLPGPGDSCYMYGRALVESAHPSYNPRTLPEGDLEIDGDPPASEYVVGLVDGKGNLRWKHGLGTAHDGTISMLSCQNENSFLLHHGKTSPPQKPAEDVKGEELLHSFLVSKDKEGHERWTLHDLGALMQLEAMGPLCAHCGFSGAALEDDGGILLGAAVNSPVSPTGRALVLSFLDSSDSGADPVQIQHVGTSATPYALRRLAMHCGVALCLLGIPWCLFSFAQARTWLHEHPRTELPPGMSALGWVCLVLAFLPCIALWFFLEPSLLPDDAGWYDRDLDSMGIPGFAALMAFSLVARATPILVIATIAASLYASLMRNLGAAAMPQWLAVRLLLLIFLGTMMLSVASLEVTHNHTSELGQLWWYFVWR